MSVAGILAGGISVITDIVSQSVIAQALLLTTQRELLFVLAAVLAVIFWVAETMLTRFFDRDNTLSDNVEHVILRYVAIGKLALGLILVRLAIGIVTELFDASALRWNDAVVCVFLVLSSAFMLLERASASATPPAKDAGATPQKKTE